MMAAMPYNPEIHHRQSNRLPGYNYTQHGMYFVTVCTHGRECLFGKIIDSQMIMNDLGHVVAEEWVKTAEIRSNVELDIWVVMPNHFHAIVVIDDDNPPRRGDLRSPFFQQTHGESIKPFRSANQGDRQVAPTGPRAKSIGAIMSGFKSAVTKRINIVRQTPGLPLWQRNYWDHVIRDEADLKRIREYVATNPLRWESDTFREESS